jgi:hypothetical protein
MLPKFLRAVKVGRKVIASGTEYGTEPRCFRDIESDGGHEARAGEKLPRGTVRGKFSFTNDQQAGGETGHVLHAV